jgi:hypothetical protein
VVCPVLAADRWCQAPLGKWTEARTVDSCTEAMPPEGRPFSIPLNDRAAVPVPEPPFGTWKEDGASLAAVGLANCWSTMLMPGDRAGGVITVRLAVERSSGAERQLPGGCVRWGFHWGENLPGWDAGIVLGYQDPLNFYRLQVSATRGELALWDSTGGFLQLIPCPFEAGKPHDLTVRWQEGHLAADVDGKLVMDYWDRTLPYTRGRVGLAVWRSAVRVDRFQVADAPGAAGPAPAHTPRFRFEPCRNILSDHPAFHMMPQSGLILFDGYEPVSCFWKQPPDQGGEGSRGTLFHEAVKLKPGWRPASSPAGGPLTTRTSARTVCTGWASGRRWSASCPLPSRSARRARSWCSSSRPRR